MSQFFHVHPANPQARLIRQAADIILQGGVVAYPTDSAYALGCRLGNKEGLERIRRLRQLDDKHNFTLVCRDLSELGVYAKVDNVFDDQEIVSRDPAGARPNKPRTGYLGMKVRF